MLSLEFRSAIVKLFSTRRNPDAAQKQQILESASSVANVLLKHLDPMESGGYDHFFICSKAKFSRGPHGVPVNQFLLHIIARSCNNLDG